MNFKFNDFVYVCDHRNRVFNSGRYVTTEKGEFLVFSCGTLHRYNESYYRLTAERPPEEQELGDYRLIYWAETDTYYPLKKDSSILSNEQDTGVTIRFTKKNNKIHVYVGGTATININRE